MKITKALFLLIFLGYEVLGQQFITSTQIYYQKTNYEFDNLWQFISSELYLVNADKFNFLLNNLSPDKRKIKKNKDVISNILITAQTSGLNELDKLVYPIFNFQVTTDKNNNLVVNTSESEVIKLIDNVPISSVKEFIGAKIQVQAYTKSNKPEIYKFLANQLVNIAALSSLTLTEAGFKLVGEIGKMMQNDAAGKQYQFESTIRFYQENNFDRRFHSIVIYVFLPSYIKSISFDSSKINKYLDTVTVQTFDRNLFKKLINIPNYPYVVVVNYRTKYKIQLSEDIQPDILANREMQNENLYATNKISRDVYIQEKNLINFLKAYAQLQKDVTTYEINYKSKLTEDFTIQLFMILQDYWKLNNLYNLANKEFSTNSLFINEFRAYYNRYLNRSYALFETTSALRSIKSCVDVILALEKSGLSNLDSLKIEDNLRKLKSVKIPSREINSDEAVLITNWINKLEVLMLTNYIKPLLNNISKQKVNDDTYYNFQKIKMNVINSSCNICIDEVLGFEKKFMPLYENYLFTKNLENYKTTLLEAKKYYFKVSETLMCINQNFDSTFINSQQPLAIAIKKSLDDLEKDLNELQNLIDKKFDFKTYLEIDEATRKIVYQMNNIKGSLAILCENKHVNCECKNQAEKSE